MSAATQINRTLKKLREGKIVHVYVTGNFASPRHVDFICQSGYFGVLWFDLEHFDIPVQELAVLNMVARGYQVSSIARLKATDYQTVMRVLETGVGGIMCSMVGGPEEARQIVKWAKFNNPQPVSGEVTGSRGWNGGNIDSRYANLPALEYMREQNNETMIICQIEYEEAVARAAEIAATPGVDGLFFGPGDYSASIGLVGQLSHPRVIQAMERVATASKAAGKWWGTVAVGQESYQRVKMLGAQFICPGGDLKVMNLGLKELVKTFEGGKNGQVRSEPKIPATSAGRD